MSGVSHKLPAIERLKHLISQDTEKFQETLDSLVHDVYSQRASDLNNHGYDEQISFLVGELGLSYLLTQLGIDAMDL